MRRLLPVIIVFCITRVAYTQNNKPDPVMVQQIREEGLNNSQVMDIAFYLTEVSGPRLNNSPGYKRAANWAKNKLTEWGLENARLEPWGIWGKGWELQRCYVAMSAPYYKPVIAFPKTWTSGTGREKNADVVLVTAANEDELLLYKGKLKGKVVLLPRRDTLEPTYEADASRRSEESLQRMEEWSPGSNAGAPRRSRRWRGSGQGRSLVSANRLKKFAEEEGAIAILSTSPRGRDGTLFVQGGGAYKENAPENFLDIMLAYEDYMMLQRLAEKNIPVKLEVDIRSRFYTDDMQGYNVIAEIRGTDPKLKEELVMIGGHLDSWHGSVGATDNAAGCAVMMEALRILKKLGVKPRRTIRIALWGGEEQGLHGSRNYVRNHFTDTATRRFNAAGDKLSVYFNLDNGTGKIRGVYLQGNEGVKDIFKQWLEPFHDLDAATVTLQNTGGTDHLAFDAIGLPGFQFIQDQIEYNTRTHHTTMDSYDHLQAADLMQAATIVASFVYNAAQRDEKLPRKQPRTTAARRGVRSE